MINSQEAIKDDAVSRAARTQAVRTPKASSARPLEATLGISASVSRSSSTFNSPEPHAAAIMQESVNTISLADGRPLSAIDIPARDAKAEAEAMPGFMMLNICLENFIVMREFS